MANERPEDEVMEEMMGATASGRLFLRALELARLDAGEEEAVQELRGMADQPAALEEAQRRLLGLLDERPDDPEGSRALHLLNEALSRGG